jgi:hypothetical protein
MCICLVVATANCNNSCICLFCTLLLVFLRFKSLYQLCISNLVFFYLMLNSHSVCLSLISVSVFVCVLYCMLNSLSHFCLCFYILYGLLKSLFLYLVWLAELCLSLCLSVFCIKCRFLSLPISFVFIELSLQVM